MICAYLLIGGGVWLGAGSARYEGLLKSNRMALARGLAFAVLGWPLGLPILVATRRQELRVFGRGV